MGLCHSEFAGHVSRWIRRSSIFHKSVSDRVDTTTVCTTVCGILCAVLYRAQSNATKDQPDTALNPVRLDVMWGRHKVTDLGEQIRAC